MLRQLGVENFGIIEQLSLDFSPGLTVLSGETGAGKSLIVGALGLVLGGRADAAVVRSGAQEAQVIALFSGSQPVSEILDEWGYPIEDELLITRSVSHEGRSKCWVNGRPATVRVLAALGQMLVDLHGQHEHQALMRTGSHLGYLDGWLGADFEGKRVGYETYYHRWRRLREDREELARLQQERAQEEEFLDFQISEIDASQLEAGEEERLTAERVVLRNSQELLASAAEGHRLLEGEEGSGALDLLRQAEQRLVRAAELDPGLEEVRVLIADGRASLEETALALLRYPDGLDVAPGRLEEVEDRLAAVALLKRKYGATVEEVLVCLVELRQRRQNLSELDSRTDVIERDLEEAGRELLDRGLALSVARKEGARLFADRVVSELEQLNLPSVRFEVAMRPREDAAGIEYQGLRLQPGPSGLDEVEYLLAANPGEPMLPLRQVASGGEISRVMLAIKTAFGSADPVPTLVFDEVDAGIGGRTAMAAGAKLADVARSHQVICVTHLPQITCFADHHVVVSKEGREERTVTTAKPLSSLGRVGELARMLNGEESAVSMEHAQELLKYASDRKSTIGPTVR